MALRITQVAVLVLRTSTSTNLAPVQASSQVNLHPATSVAADFKRASSLNVAFAYTPHNNRDGLADASTVLILAAASQAVTDWLISASSAFNVAPAAAGVRDVFPSGSVSLALADSGTGPRAVFGNASTLLLSY